MTADGIDFKRQPTYFPIYPDSTEHGDPKEAPIWGRAMSYAECAILIAAGGDRRMSTANSWKPKTGTDRRLVEEELGAILASPHFRNSKRYPTLLRHVVEKSLDGQIDHLKERTLGVEVFGRQPDYDTNADPIVRVSAGEIRKRIAQYYHEAAEKSKIQIDLPTGSYVPEFRKGLIHSRRVLVPEPESLPGTVAQSEHSVLSDAVQSDERARSRLPKSFSKTPSRLPIVLSLCVLASVTVLGTLFVHRANSTRQVNQLWGPILQTQDSVLIVIGCGKPWLVTPESPETSLSDHMIGPYHHVSVQDTIAISHLVNILQRQNRNYFIKEASATSLADLRGRTVILVGALNNAWTLRLADSLRFRFVPGTLARIEDKKNPQNSAWSVDYSKPYSSLSVDYGIVARYHDTFTNGNILIIAGIGPYGTEAGSELVSSPQYLSQIEPLVPAGFKDANLEMVIRTNVINGEAGPPQLVAAYAF